MKKKVNDLELEAERRILSDQELADGKECRKKNTRNGDHCKVRHIQKARMKWVCDGDENTSFFHNYLKIKNRRCNVHGLMIDGSWVTDPASIKKEKSEFFGEKLCEWCSVRSSFINHNLKKISDCDRRYLEAPFELNEIKDAIWSCGSDKAPGPDGFTFRFIKHF